MRYEDWDILLFPRDCKVPIKEFKVACHVTHDTEFAHIHGSHGLPTVCCFVPSLPLGAPFQVSIHSWSSPSISQFTRSYSKYTDTVKFEARLFIDGRFVASTSLDRTTVWPHVVAHSFDFSKNGDLEGLKFPPFRQELLQQNYWSPADDLGRIKVIISEGFPRDSLSMPIERVKNVAAFSFQHAPLEILESSGIAWPNPSMWRRAPFAASMPVPSLPSEDVDSHAHSPRRRTGGLSSGGPSNYHMAMMQGAMGNSIGRDTRHHSQPTGGLLSVGNSSSADPFSDSNAYFEWLGGMGMGIGLGESAGMSSGQSAGSQQRSRRKTSTDVSMPDYSSSSSHNTQMPVITEQQFVVSNARQEDDSIIAPWKVPTNTPTTSAHINCETEGVPFPLLSHNSFISPELANTLTNSLLNQPIPAQLQTQAQSFHTPAPASELRSRKENRLQQLGEPSPSTLSSSSTSAHEHNEMRRVSQNMYIPSTSTRAVTVSSQANSPQSVIGQELGVSNTEEFGISNADLTSTEPPLVTISGNSMEKGTKRVRNFMSSSKAIGDEEDSHRPSPRRRLASHAGDDQPNNTT